LSQNVKVAERLLIEPNFTTSKPQIMNRFLTIAFLFIFLFSSCHYVSGKRIRGNGKMKSENRTAGTFNGIDASGIADVYVKQDSLTTISIETDENLMEYILIENDGGTIHIRQKNGTNLKPSKAIKIFISSPVFKHFEASGACNYYSESKIVSEEPVSIDLSGSSDVKLELKSPKIDADLSGAGTITLKGETKDFKVQGSGSTDIRCFDLMTENTTVEISGAGDAEVFASVKLDVHVSGAADVKYKGNAAVTKEISGAGSVKKME
jgi:hypothetical protein